jgi:protein TonB
MINRGTRLPLWHHLNRDSFGFMLFIATAVHGVLLLALSFSFPERVPPRQTLDITLAQYPQQDAPDNADFIAQSNQQGSGQNEDATTPTTTEMAPLASERPQEQAAQQTPAPPEPAKPPAPEPEPGNSPEQQESQAQGQKAVVATPSEQNPRASEPRPQQAAAAPPPLHADSTSLLNRALEMASLQTQLDLERETRAKKPRVLRLTSASTQAHAYASYLDNWRRRVETVGNLNYPEQARSQGLTGTLRLLVVLRPDGSVEHVEILQSSGHRVLDEGAIRIVQLASPFQSFPIELRKEVDRLEIIRTWKFEKQTRVY